MPKPTRTPSMSDSLWAWEMVPDPKTGKLMPKPTSTPGPYPTIPGPSSYEFLQEFLWGPTREKVRERVEGTQRRRAIDERFKKK